MTPEGNHTCSEACTDSQSVNITTNSKNASVAAFPSCICVREIEEETGDDNFLIFLIIICVSGFTLFINLLLIIITCTVNKISLPSVFGTALMFFNILLSLYGVALAVYLMRGYVDWDQKFCQGFTSMKLFALGASVWTMMMLTFHRSVRADIETEREAIFKGIVYILEGLMLSGVFAVMSWIKLDKFDYLCVVFEPVTIVDWLLAGIEIFYYFMLFCLVLRYPYHQIQKKERSGKKRLDTSHPIFAMVLLCFVSWGTVYIVTLPAYGLASDRIRRLIRVVGIIAPLSLQALIIAARNTWCCLCRDPPCAKKKEIEVPVCKCTGTETCTVCEDEYEALRHGAQLNYGNGKVKEKEITKPVKEKKEKKKKAKKEKKEKKKNKQKLTTTSITIEKSPILKHKETSFNEIGEEVNDDNDVAETPLLQDSKQKKEQQKEKEQRNKALGKTSDDSTPLLDDTDGSHAPKAVHDGTPVRSGHTTEHPSFVHMDSAVDVDSLPKEKPPKTIEELQIKNSQEPDERKSRGPTFFPLTEKTDTANTDEPVTKRPTKSPKKKKKKKKKSASHENGNIAKKESSEKQTNGDDKRTSTASLEWDHYSDSSGSISRSSECFPDDLLVDDGGEDETLLNKTHEQKNGISRNDSAIKSTTDTDNSIEQEKLSCENEKQAPAKDQKESKISKKKNKNKAKFMAGEVNGELTAN